MDFIIQMSLLMRPWSQLVPSCYLIFGANSAIAKAYIAHISANTKNPRIICVSRTNVDLPNIEFLSSDYSKASLNKVTEYLHVQNLIPTQVIIFNGLLHNEQMMPEKKLEALDEASFNELFTANTLAPILCVQAVLPLLTNTTACVITALSARVGSIKDNNLGGWYSYRASKAALNMLFKTTAIELGRRAKLSRLVLFHPGTTDTNLSKPFQKNVPKDKLFTPEFVAKQLFNLLLQPEKLTQVGTPAYIDWQGQPIDW
ncbi:MAG: NAD(P)-dependent dehydrogenase (short-subunit alcohol dehydrogenase family) [Reinekea sp.]|jgi:NAD(P)-dependent dehydrogenase (short-subunit alcohol dehydrogenase family)